MTNSSLSLALPDSQQARRWHGMQVPAVGLLVVLSADARTTLRVFGAWRCP